MDSCMESIQLCPQSVAKSIRNLAVVLLFAQKGGGGDGIHRPLVVRRGRESKRAEGRNSGLLGERGRTGDAGEGANRGGEGEEEESDGERGNGRGRGRGYFG
jgi:hypothetical protein